MKILIPNDCPEVATKEWWRQTLDYSHQTLWRAEKQGKLIPTGPKRHKLYTKKAIMKWLEIAE